MADFEAPSFSLGLDFDLIDSEPHITTVSEDKNPSSSNQFPAAAKTLDDEDDDFETLTVDDSEPENPDPPPKLRRLRRGSTVDTPSSSVPAKTTAELQSRVFVDDEDIEEFSSQEDRNTDGHISTQHHSVCSSSKFPLNGHGVLTKQSGKRKHNASSAPESVITNCSNSVFPLSTISPLRRFQLIDSDSDSDSDDPSIVECANRRKCDESGSYLNRRQSNSTQHVGLSEQRKVNKSINISTKEDLWEDFRPERSFHIPTPALDEVCEEYFRSTKDKNEVQCNTRKTNKIGYGAKTVVDLGDPIPPARHYFFHEDSRIRELVRTRLPNFFPLSDMKNRDFEQPSTSNIDYMGQFNRGESTKQAAKNHKAEKSSSSKKNSRNSKTKETSQGWTNPKLSTDKGTPKDAGKRRVHAVGQAAGHWFTGPDGRRVYVGKNGQELTGRVAYIQYKKDTGAGFKKARAKKKTSTKKK